MPRSRETKAALEVNAGANCLAGVAVFLHRYVAVPLYFFNLLIKGRLFFRRPLIFNNLQIFQLFSFCDNLTGNDSFYRRQEMRSSIIGQR